jgi:colicin import membrane protein
LRFWCTVLDEQERAERERRERREKVLARVRGMGLRSVQQLDDLAVSAEEQEAKQRAKQEREAAKQRAKQEKEAKRFAEWAQQERAQQEREAKQRAQQEREAKQRAQQEREARQHFEALEARVLPKLEHAAAKLRAELAEQERAERERRRRPELDAQWRVGEAKWRYADAVVKDGYIPDEKREHADWRMALVLRN